MYRDDDYDLRAEVAEERRRTAYLRHWCSECHGHTGPGSPCAPEPEEEEAEETNPDEE